MTAEGYEVGLGGVVPAGSGGTFEGGGDGEADSGGHTDQRPMLALLPAILTLRERLAEHHPVAGRVRAPR